MPIQQDVIGEDGGFMYDTEKFQLQTCYHCGNKGLLPIEFQHTHDFSEFYENEEGMVIELEPGCVYTWFMLSCPVCNHVTLFRIIKDPYVDPTYNTILYPTCTISWEGVPDDIKTAFESALKVKHIDTAICVLALRRVLEAVCKDRGAVGKDLNEMIDNMIGRNILPSMFDDACWIIRQLGNSAAHADKKVFSPYQVDQTIEFIQNIINYLYTLPIKMKKLRQTIEHEKEFLKRNSETKKF